MFGPIVLAALLLLIGTSPIESATPAAFGVGHFSARHRQVHASFGASALSLTSARNNVHVNRQQQHLTTIDSSAQFPLNKRRKRRVFTHIFSATNGYEGEGYSSEREQIDQRGYYIRRGQFKDLRRVADLMMDAFYEENSIMYHYHRMLELDRLQANFPYDSTKHDFFVACCPDGDIIGFVDVDARPSMRKDAPPRPYLSDLAVDSKWRRRGIATSLIEVCEDKARDIGCDTLHLRVEGNNDAALKIYCANMKYEEQEHPVFGVKDTTILLKCDLQQRLEMVAKATAEAEAEVGEVEEKNMLRVANGAHWSSNNGTAVVLDYSV